MHKRRSRMLWLLVLLFVWPIVLGLLSGGAVGTVEVALWAGLLVAWVAVFATWARRTT